MRPPGETCRDACPNTTKVPRRLVVITLSKRSKSSLSIGESGIMPAQFTTTLIPPNVSTASLNRCSTSAAFATSAWTAMACPLLPLISATTSLALVELPAKFTITANPSCAGLVATARPIPREAPMTMTLLVVDAPTIISYSPWVQGDHRGLYETETRPGYDLRRH
jgi:hypothetical protein